MGGAEPRWLESLLAEREESLRYWVIRLLVDDPVSARHAGPALIKAAQTDSSWLGRMALASALSALEADARWNLGVALAAGMEKDAEPNLVRLLWSGWGVDVGDRPNQALDLAPTFRASALRTWTMRRVAETSGHRPEIASAMLRVMAATRSAEVTIDLMTGTEAGLRAGAIALSEATLAPLRARYDSVEGEIHHPALRLGARMGDEIALRRLGDVVTDPHAAADWRRRALESLSAARPPWLPRELLKLLGRPEIAEQAIRALASTDDPAVAPSLLKHYVGFSRSARIAAIDALIARPSNAVALLDALVAGTVPKTDVSRAQVRQLAALKDAALGKRVEQVFGSINSPPEAVAARIRKLRYTLKDAAYMQTADIKHGQALFAQRCAACHALFGSGGSIGPDLTGSGRKDLEYLLTNIIDPNASISAEWRLAIATLNEGEVISGSVVAEYEDSVTLQTLNGPVKVPRARIRSLERSATSLMPAGLTDDLTVDQVRDLFGFLMSDTDATTP